MAYWITQRGTTMPIIGQPTLMECWITCYQMLLKSANINWSMNQIEKKLKDGGFSNASNCRVSGITGEELVNAAQALGVGYKTTSSINSLSGVKIMLQLCGPLWVAGHFEGSDGQRHPHVVMVIGVNEDGHTVGFVNPWQQNMWDKPTIGWMHWTDFRKAIKGTLNTEASLQYITGIQSVVLAIKK